MSEDFEVESYEERPKRPGFLTTLCILSFISIGIGILSGLANLAMGPTSDEQMKEMRVELTTQTEEMKDMGMDSFANILEQIQSMTEEMNSSFYLATSLNLIIVLLGLFAVIKMMKGFKLGFHLYIVYCLLGICSLYTYVSPGNIPTFLIVVNLIFSGLFVLLYSRNLKWMTL